jgi:hypothetical protein
VKMSSPGQSLKRHGEMSVPHSRAKRSLPAEAKGRMNCLDTSHGGPLVLDVVNI